MPASVLQRNPVTTWLLTILAAAGKPVGDGELPSAGAGWIGQPNAPDAAYEPFCVLSENVADRSWGPISDSQADWQLPYIVESFGVQRLQCSSMADKVRKQLVGHHGELLEIDGVEYGVDQLRIDSIGGPQRIAVADPVFWHAQDGVTVWLMKGNPV